MAASQKRALNQFDLERAVRAVAELFDTDEFVIVGSQALLVERNDLDRDVRYSAEFDIYPAKIEAWRAKHPGVEASEEISALLGEGSHFHKSHGFYLDGVDETTAKLPADWADRQVRRKIAVGDDRLVYAVAPCATDVVAAKLMRADPKDVQFASICYRRGLTSQQRVLAAIDKIPGDPAVIARAKQMARKASETKHSLVRTKGPKDSDPSIGVLFHQRREDRSR